VIALSVIAVIVLAGSFAGFLARFHHKMDLEQWTVGGRGFGLVLVWLLMAGEIYTTFTFLGASGWAYSKGAPVLYILAYQPLNFVISFYILPPLWEAGRKCGLQTQADFFQVRYGSTHLAAFVALIGVSCLIPYLQVQLTGLGIIVEVASFGAIHRTPAMIVGFGLVAAFVFVSGIRGVAWASTVKDLLLLCVALFVGIAVPRIYFGGIGPMFSALVQAKPNHLVMPGATKDLGHAWFISTVLMVSLSFYMWPQFFAASFSAHSGKTLRRNAVLMPLYSITMPLMIFVGLSAVLVLPGLSNGDLAALTMVRKTFPAWFLGLVGGSGRHSTAGRSDVVFEEPVPSDSGARDDGTAGCAGGQDHGRCTYSGRFVFRHSQLGKPGVAAAAGIRWCRATLTRGRLRTFFPARDYSGCFCRHGGGHSACRTAHSDWA